MKLSIILLAAGLSARMGKDKLLMELKSKPLLQHAIDLLDKTEAFEKLIVTTKTRLTKITVPNEVKAIINTDPGRGLSSSIKLAVENSSGTHFLFMTADRPKLTISDITQIINTSKLNPDKIIYPMTDGSPNTPVLFPESKRDELLSLTGDTGGRVLREKYPQICLAVLPENPENFTDINTLEDYYALS